MNDLRKGDALSARFAGWLRTHNQEHLAAAAPGGHLCDLDCVSRFLADRLAHTLAVAFEEVWDEGHRLTAPHGDQCEPTCPNPYRIDRADLVIDP